MDIRANERMGQPSYSLLSMTMHTNQLVRKYRRSDYTYLNRCSIDIEAFSIPRRRWQIIEHFANSQLELTLLRLIAERIHYCYCLK